MAIDHRNAALLVVDVQDRLIDTINSKIALLENIKALTKTAQVLSIPILVTEQENLGETVSELREMLPPFKTRKLEFSCCRVPEFMSKLQQTGKKNIIICGIETHICVLQTAIDIVSKGYTVIVPEDATSSFSAFDRGSAIKRMRHSGIIITTSEALIYELTEAAGTEVFRSILNITKERRSKTAK